MHTKDSVLVHAAHLLLITKRAFGVQAECHDGRTIMSLFRMCRRAGTVGDLRGIQVRPPGRDSADASALGKDALTGVPGSPMGSEASGIPLRP